MTSDRARVLLLGAGRMGSALLEGWRVRNLLATPPIVLEPHPTDLIKARAAEKSLILNPLPGEAPDIAIIAVKPQTLDQGLATLKPHLAARTLVLSIAAGITLARLSSALGGDRALVRAMPNMPAAIGKGITVCIARGGSDETRALSARLLHAVGDVVWIQDETLMDIVTAVSGSGPAYVFLLVEALAAAAVAQGLAPELGLRLARQTIIGAGALLEASGESAAMLRQAVTSPGGTTEAALSVLMGADGLHALLSKAVAAATERSRVLGAR